VTDLPASTSEPLGRVLVIVPTYNEADNVERIVARTRVAVPAADLLIADDDSPDGTGEIADKLAADDAAVHVLHRQHKNGLGGAYLAGFRWALSRDYDVVVEMDADGSHQPEQLPLLLDRLATADLVLGSRWVRGWEGRQLATVSSGALARRQLLRQGRARRAAARRHGGLPAFRRTALVALDLDGVASQGYCFQVDLAWRALQRGLRVAEVPITFVEREVGASKMSGAIVREALWRVTVWGARHRATQVRSALSRRR
jgi:dolichol-phosphate mannosyltransferase